MMDLTKIIPLNDKIPLIVLLEIADSLGLDYQTIPRDYYFYDDLLSNLMEIPPILIDKPYKNQDYRLIAKFVNKNIAWDKEPLLQAFDFLITSLNSENTELLQNSLGLQTNENPFSLNNRILYKLCLSLNIFPKRDCQNLHRLLRLFFTPLPDLMTNLHKHLFGMSQQNLIELCYSLEIISENPIEPEIAYESLRNTYESLCDVKRLRQDIVPFNNLTATTLAALNFNMNISYSQYPMLEYFEILRKTYQYHDPKFRKIIENHPMIISLNHYFSPLFPEQYYSNEVLRSMAFQEGFTQEEIDLEGSYNLLQLAYISNGFYVGKIPELTTDETMVELEKIDNISNLELVCYGNKEFKNLVALTYPELFQMFTYNGLIDPLDPQELISNRSISKLMMLCQQFDGCSSELTEQKLKLFQLLTKTMKEFKNMDDETIALIHACKDSEIRNKVIVILGILLEMGMYMRGWNGEGEFPVAKAIVPSEMMIVVEVKSNASISQFEEECRQNPKIGKIIKNLPLVQYRGGKYVKSNSNHEGITIQDRIDIVKKGETTSISSCIRMSSNWFIASAHKYITILGLPAPFDIFKMRQIS